ncbi:MAG: flagellar hook capping FlgD N-terminal domain-containing protein [Yoonia sp.]|nr:flagellar hook capping FlgD N-terminal domain-containing protein [Yoonia sp.]
MDIGALSNPQQANTSGAFASGSSTKEISSDFETFLKMLTVQMQNQDPLNPVDSSDYAVQLATFSGVEQQVQTNDLLRGLTALMGTSGMAQMASWVGKEARAPAAAYFGGSPVTLAPNPAIIAEKAEIIVRNASGTEVDRFETPVSADPVQWSGMDAEGFPRPLGLYSFEIVSSAGGDILAQAPVDVYGTITEVRSQGGETVLILQGGAAISATQVSALRDPSL